MKRESGSESSHCITTLFFLPINQSINKGGGVTQYTSAPHKEIHVYLCHFPLPSSKAWLVSLSFPLCRKGGAPGRGLNPPPPRTWLLLEGEKRDSTQHRWGTHAHHRENQLLPSVNQLSQ